MTPKEQTELKQDIRWMKVNLAHLYKDNNVNDVIEKLREWEKKL